MLRTKNILTYLEVVVVCGVVCDFILLIFQNQGHVWLLDGMKWNGTSPGTKAGLVPI